MKETKEIQSDASEEAALLFDKAYKQCDPALLYADSEQVRIAAPQYILDYLKEFHIRMTGQIIQKATQYRGFYLVPGYENAIVFYHISAPLWPNESRTIMKMML